VAEREKVDLTVDFITSQGDKLALTATAEGQARSGHDILALSDWYAAAQADNLEPVDDLVSSLIKEHGRVLLGSEYIGRQKGRWIGVPTGLQTTWQIPCARIDYLKQFAGFDITRMYPAGAPPDKALTDAWTWDGFLVAAQKCAAAGHAFGMPLSTWSDSVNWVSAVFAAHGAQLVDEEGNVTVKSDAVREVLAWFQKIVPSLPPSVFAWDNAANNKWLISGQGALIMNPPGAWAVAVRDAPDVAEQLWTSIRRGARKVASIRAISAFGGSGISRPTNQRPRAFSPGCQPAPRSNSLSRGAAALTFRPTKSYATSRPGRRKNRPPVPSTITRRTTMCSPVIRRRQASAHR